MHLQSIFHSRFRAKIEKLRIAGICCSRHRKNLVGWGSGGPHPHSKQGLSQNFCSHSSQKTWLPDSTVLCANLNQWNRWEICNYIKTFLSLSEITVRELLRASRLALFSLPSLQSPDQEQFKLTDTLTLALFSCHEWHTNCDCSVICSVQAALEPVGLTAEYWHVASRRFPGGSWPETQWTHCMPNTKRPSDNNQFWLPVLNLDVKGSISYYLT